MKSVIMRILAAMFVLLLMMAPALAEGEQSGLSLTTGLPTDQPYKPIQITLDNEPGARPQIGMSRADIVFEFEAYDGGYTRYLAVFNDDVPQIAEGCRSTRLPALEMYWNFGGALAHYGGYDKGAANVNAFISKLNVDSQFDGIKGDPNYYRDNKRKMPHNAVAKLQDMLDKTGEIEPRQMLSFSAENPTIKGEEVTEFGIPYRKSGGYYPSYKYNADENVYYYYFNGKQMADGADGALLKYANVMVINYKYTFADGLSKAPMIDSTGAHAVEYFIGGKHFTGTCERESLFTTMKFLDDEGNEVQFIPGKTFIQMPQSHREIDYIA
jgi:hypothetical protein